MKKTAWISSLLLASTLIINASCSNSSNDNSVAKVHGDSITDADIEAFLKLKNIPENDETKKKRMVKDYLFRESLAQQIEATNVLDKQLIKAELNEIRKEILINRYFQHYLDERVTEEAVENYYAANKSQFQTEKVKVSHILVRATRDMSDTERQMKLNQIHQIHAKASVEEDFAALASHYSEDANSAQRGGDLGWLQKGAISQTLSDAVFAMKPGDISEPVKTEYGFHILRLEEGPEIIETPFEKVKGDIRFRLRQQAKQAEMERLTKASAIDQLD